MAYSSGRLPSRFPVGTKFVIEGKRGGEGQVQVFSRYLEFPDGTFLPLPVRPAKQKVGRTAGGAVRGARVRGPTDPASSANGLGAGSARPLADRGRRLQTRD